MDASLGIRTRHRRVLSGRAGKTRLAASSGVLLHPLGKQDLMRQDGIEHGLLRRVTEEGYRELRAQGYDLQ